VDCRKLFEPAPAGRGPQHVLSEHGRSVLHQAIVEGDTQLLVELGEALGELLADSRVSASQLRDIINAFRRIHSRFRWDDALLLKPRLRYRAARHSGRSGLDMLCSILIAAIDMVEGDPKRFSRAFELLKAAVAYSYSPETT